MEKNLARNAFNRVVLYKAQIKKNQAKHKKDLDEQDDLKGSARYEAVCKQINGTFISACKEAKDACLADLKRAKDKMMEIASKRDTTPPTSRVESTLRLLSMLKPGTLTVKQANEYLKDPELASCPLALQVFQQICETHHIHLRVPTPTEHERGVECFISNLSLFVTNYNGESTPLSATVGFINNLIMDDNEALGKYSTVRSSDESYREFWNKYVGCSSPDVFDDPSSTNYNPTIEYFFSSFDGFMDYIHRSTEGKLPSEAEEITQQILSGCPDRYGIAYRLYKSTGEKIDINNPGDDSDAPSD